VLGVVVALSAVLLRSVLATVFFAVTIAYILYPLRRFLVAHGAGPRLAAAASTVTAFVVGVLLFTPLLAALYLRRDGLFAFLSQFPEQIDVAFAGVAYTVDVQAALEASEGVLEGLAIETARALPALALKAFLFTLVVYALLLKPGELRRALLRPVPGRYHDVVLAFHRRTRSILYAIYVLQAAVAFGTFLIGYVVYAVLGYDAAFTLAVVSGILQFIPILGPSVVIVALAGVELIASNVADAAIVTVVGLVVVGFLPDALIRPRLARLTTGIPGSLYFVGFTGGVLSVGLVGLVAGPVVVALLAEAVSLLTAESQSIQQRLTDTPGAGEPDGDPD
jgi:predicted PurR-regulated permease PerM